MKPMMPKRPVRIPLTPGELAEAVTPKSEYDVIDEEFGLMITALLSAYKNYDPETGVIAPPPLSPSLMKLI